MLRAELQKNLRHPRITFKIAGQVIPLQRAASGRTGHYEIHLPEISVFTFQEHGFAQLRVRWSHDDSEILLKPKAWSRWGDFTGTATLANGSTLDLTARILGCSATVLHDGASSFATARRVLLSRMPLLIREKHPIAPPLTLGIFAALFSESGSSGS